MNFTIQQLFERNLYLFPLRKGTKQPAIYNWQNLAVNNLNSFKERFNSFNSNPPWLGVRTTFPLGVIDIDNRPEPIAFELMQIIYAKLNLPNTLSVTTQNNGYHLYFYFSTFENLSLSSFKIIHPQIDLICKIAYVVAPTVENYKIINNSPIANFPLEGYKLIKQKPKNITLEKQEIHIDYLSINSYQSYIKKVIENSILRIQSAKEGTINNTLFSQTANVASFLHYNFFTIDEIINNFYKIIETKALQENWTDWHSYKYSAIKTIKSAIKAGQAQPKYIKNFKEFL